MIAAIDELNKAASLIYVESNMQDLLRTTELWTCVGLGGVTTDWAEVDRGRMV